MRILRRLLLGSVFICSLEAQAQSAGAGVETIKVSIAPVVYAGLPIWAEADRRPEKTGNYPFSAYSLSSSGLHELELRFGNVPVPVQDLNVQIQVFAGRVRPTQLIQHTIADSVRLPLHALFAISQPGRYSLRWTEWGQKCADDAVHQALCPTENWVIARSDWVDFDVELASPATRETWLKDYLASEPVDSYVWVDEYLPDLLAGLPDLRVFKRLAEKTYATKQGYLTTAAEAALWGFDGPAAEATMRQVIDARGPNATLTRWAAMKKNEPLPH